MSTGHDQIDQHYLDAIADADQYPYWIEDVDEPDSNPTLVRTEIVRPVRRRRRLHRAVDGDHRQGARPVRRRRTDRRPRMRFRRQRSQRRVHGRQPHPWCRQRDGALARRDRDPRGARPAQPERDRGGDPQVRDRLRLRAHRRDRGRQQVPPADLPRRGPPGVRAARPARPRRRVPRRRGDAGRKSTPRSTPAGSGPRTTARSSTRPGSCGVSRRPPNGSACGSTRTPRPPNSSGTGSASSSRHRSARSGPARWRSPRTPSSPC